MASTVEKIMNINVVNNIKGLKPRDQLAKIQTGITGCTGNADITNPDPPLADCQAAHDAAETQLDAIDVEEKKLQDMRTVRDQLMDATIGKHTTLGSCVQTKARKANDPGIVTKAGFDLASDRVTKASAGRVINLSLSWGDHSGTVDAHWNRDASAKVYEVQANTGPSGAYVTLMQPSKSSCTLTGLTSGSTVSVRVRAIGPGEPGEWSQLATIVVP